MSDGVAVKIGEPRQVKGEGTFELNHYIYPISITFSNGQKSEFERRYSDFFTLRQLLVNEFSYCIVPPVPEKAIFQNEETLQYRKAFLKAFLLRVACHASLGTCELFVHMFPDDTRWESLRNSKIASDDGFTKVIKDNLKRTMSSKNNAKMAAAGPAYKKALDKSVPISDGDWELVALHVEADKNSLSDWQNQLGHLAHQKRNIALAMDKFSNAFIGLSEEEDEEDLKSAIRAVQVGTKSAAGVYDNQCTEELEKVVFKVSYLVGMCNSAYEAITKLYADSEYLNNLTKDIEERRRTMVTKTEEKRQAVLAQVNELERRREQLLNLLNDGSRAKFREEFITYHETRQVDLLEVHRFFAKVQVKGATDYQDRV
ncbi:phosphoinositide-binding protein [Angomonas deanei]|nr:phosphoinositide-binding protein [Angomonas deanei]|eukprot:EPY27528.1 phosphoinositide-binding protein [Angomonas deanei]